MTITVEKGREFLIAPIAMMKPGMGNEMYYAESLIRYSLPLWEGRPITVDHQYVPVLDDLAIGEVRSPRFVRNRLVCFGYFDMERTNEIDPRVLKSLLNNERIEVSTGWRYRTLKWAGGSTEVYTPHHLAILPDAVGAFPVSEGFGVLTHNWIDCE